MTHQFGIQKKGSRKLNVIYIIFFAGAISFCMLAVASTKFLMFIPAFLLFFFAVRIFTSRKRILGQKIEIDDNSITYCLSTGECTTLIFSEITAAGFYAKNPSKLRYNEGMYLYSNSADRYCFIGADFDKNDELYNMLKEKCDAAGVEWHNLDYCGKYGLVKKIWELLNIKDGEDDNPQSENLQETNAE